MGSGLMFSSNGLGAAPRKSLTYFVMFIVISSIMYFGAVLGTELVIGLGLWKPKQKPEDQKVKKDEVKKDEPDDVIQFAAPAANPMHNNGRGSVLAQGGGGDSTGLLMQTKQQQEAIEQQQAEIARLKKANRVAQLQGYSSSSTSIKKKTRRLFKQASNTSKPPVP